MLVHVKKPRINVRIYGQGTRLVLESLRKSYGELRVTDDDKTLVIQATDWFKNISKSLTPGDILATYRDNAELTLDQLSEKSGIPKSNLSQMENNKRAIGPMIARKLALVFGCDYRCFFIS